MSFSNNNRVNSLYRESYVHPNKQEPNCRLLRSNFVLSKTLTNRNASSENVIASFALDGVMVSLV